MEEDSSRLITIIVIAEMAVIFIFIAKIIIIVMTNVFIGILPPFSGVHSQTGVEPSLRSHLAEYWVDFVWILDCFGFGLVILLWFDITLS